MRAELADGRVLDFPDGTSPEVIQATVKKVMSGGDKPTEPTMTDKAKSYGASTLSGLTALPIGAFQLGANIGDVVNNLIDGTGDGIELTDSVKQALMEQGKAVPEQYQRKGFGTAINEQIQGNDQVKRSLMDKAGREGFDWTELAGMVASPAGLIKSGFSKGMSLPGKTLQGSKVGATYGAGMPVVNSGEDFVQDKAVQTALSAVTGGAMPVVGATLRAGGRGIDKLTRPMGFRNNPTGIWNKMQGGVTGIQRDVQQHVNELLGENKKPVVDALMNPTKYPHNQNPTAAQAIAEANLANPDKRFGNVLVGLENEVAKKPQVADVLNTVYKGQKSGRDKVVNAIVKDEEAMNAAVKARTAATKPYYDAVEKSTTRVNSKPVLDKVDDILAKNKNNDSITRPLEDIRKKLAPGDKLEDQVNSLKSLSDDLGNKINSKNPTTGKNEYDVRSLTEIKKLLDQQIKQDVPEFGVAQKIHAKESAPINQMKIARALEKKTSSETGDQSAKPFIKAMEDEAKLVKTATGYKRGGSTAAEDVFKGNKEAYQGLKNVADDMNRNLEVTRMSGEVEGVFSGVKKGIEPRIPGMLKTEVVIANGLLKKIATDKTGAYSQEISRLMANPPEFAKLLSLPETSPLVQKTIETMRQLSKAATLAAAKQAGE